MKLLNFFSDAEWDVGQCVTDVFDVASPGAHGSPPLCGTLTGTHSEFDFISCTLCRNVFMISLGLH